MSKLWDKVTKNIKSREHPDWIFDNAVYVVIIGSQAYGTTRERSDIDIYGCTIPPREYLYPTRYGYIPGFSKDIPRFDQFQKHHNKIGEADIDLTIFNIVKYFRMCADCNPNMIDSLFVPDNCILYMNEVGNKLRENRYLFLSQQAVPRFMGYAFSQMKKICNKTTPKSLYRQELIRKYGYDTKYAMHLVRLVDECKQIIAEGDIDLQRQKDKLKAVLTGRYTIDKLEAWFHRQNELIEELCFKTDLPKKVDEKVLTDLLQECIS